MSLVGYFLAGILLVNGVPHFVQGISGNRFQSPFAKPPGVGESSPLVNVLWGSFNLTAGYSLLKYLGLVEIGLNGPTAAAVAGGLLTAIALAIHFGKVRKSASA